MNYIFVAYEENKNWLASESGSIDEMTIFGAESKEKALEWIKERLKVASENDYIIDNKISLDAELAKENIKIPLYRGHQDNWDYSYDLLVQKKVIN
jgi:hypothetical protein